ncbi:hypothetical protein Tco_0631405 [Tanacetum coccineum]
MAPKRSTTSTPNHNIPPPHSVTEMRKVNRKKIDQRRNCLMALRAATLHEYATSIFQTATEGVVELTQWFERMCPDGGWEFPGEDVGHDTAYCNDLDITKKKKMTDKYSARRRRDN